MLVYAFRRVGFQHGLVVRIEELRWELWIGVAEVEDAVPFVERFRVEYLAAAVAEWIQWGLAVLFFAQCFADGVIFTDLGSHSDPGVERLPDGVETVDVGVAVEELLVFIALFFFAGGCLLKPGGGLVSARS